MARNQTQKTTGIGGKQAAPSAPPKLEVYQPPAYYARVPDNGRMVADALEKALGLGTAIARDQEAAASVQGAADAEAGTVDPAQAARAGAYRRAVETSQAEATYRDLAEKMDEEVEKAVDEGEDVEAINKRIQTLHTLFLYDEDGKLVRGMDDPDVAKAILPLMQKKREAALEYARTAIRQKTETAVVADTGRNLEAEYTEYVERARTPLGQKYSDARSAGATVADARGALAGSQGQLSTEEMDAIDAEHEAGRPRSRVDWLKLNARLAPVLRGRTNAAMLELAGQMAVRFGDPKVLEGMPDTWANGAPAFQHIPALAEKLEAYRDAAAKAAETINTAQAKAAKATQDSVDNTAGSELTNKVLSGQDITGDLLSLKGQVSDELVRTMYTFQESVRNNTEAGAIDPAGSVKWTDKVFSDPHSVTVAALTSAYNAGEFGRGTKAQGRYQALVSDLATQQDRFTNNAAFRSDEYDRGQQLIRSIYLPVEVKDNTQEGAQYAAIVQKAFSEHIAGGLSYAASIKKIAEDYPVPSDITLGQHAKDYGFKPDGAVAVARPKATVDKDIASMPAADFKATYTPAEVERQRKSLDEATYIQLLTKLNASKTP